MVGESIGRLATAAEAAALQERFGHPDRAATARGHAQHARELYELAQQELQHGSSKAEPGTQPQDPRRRWEPNRWTIDAARWSGC